MPRHLLGSIVLLLCASASFSAAQTYQPKTIQFKGDPEYSTAELLAASGLKKGASYTVAQMNEHTKLLMDSGVFQDISFTFNGQDLVYRIIPATVMFPPRLENLTLPQGKELDDKLRAHFPLYHGKIPTEGTLLDDIRKEFEEELKAKGIQATILAAPYTDMNAGKITAMGFTITTPEMRVGEIQLEGASAEMAAKARLAAARDIGSTYSDEGSANKLETSLTNFYGELGYLEASARAVPQSTLVSDAQGVHVPFAITVNEGAQYKLAGVQLAPGLLVNQADFDKQSGLHTGEVVSLKKLRDNWAFLTRQYHNKGFMTARIEPIATYDHAQGAVSYSVTAEPGPVYTMGTLKILNVSDDVRDAIIAAWKVPSGAVFNEGAVRGLTATHGVNPALERLFTAVNLFYAIRLHADTRTVDVDLSLEKKH